MIDSHAIALKRLPNVAFEHLHAHANANEFDDAIVHSDADAMSVAMIATTASNSVDVVRLQRPQHLSMPVGPSSCDLTLD